MAGLLSMFGFGGDEEQAPQSYTPIDQLLGQSAGIATTQLAPAMINFNDLVSKGYANTGLGIEQMIAPGTFDLRSSVLKNLQNDVNLGYDLPQELQDLATQNYLQTLTSSGAGVSDLGKIFSARSIIGDTKNWRDQNLERAMRASPYRQYIQTQDPTSAITGIAQDLRAREMFENEQAAQRAQDSEDSNELFRTGLTIAGGVAGGIFGGGLPGAMAGASAGGLAGNLLFGAPRGGGGGNQFSSLLTGLGGMKTGGLFAPGSIKAEQAFPMGSDQSIAAGFG